MPGQKKDGGNAGKGRAGFRTDAAISNGKFGSERTLTPWVPDAGSEFDGSLEKASSNGAWDQFAANERLFGLKTDYDENIYTTAIDKSHPEYRQRVVAAERKAKEIERSMPTTAHVAEERQMDWAGKKNDVEDNEEDKYSGVRRQDFPTLSSGQENRYTPPAKRAPSGQPGVKGAPVDPAIISSQIRAQPKSQRAGNAGTDEQTGNTVQKSNGITSGLTPGKRSVTDDVQVGKTATPAAPKPSEAATVGGPSSAAASRTMSPHGREGGAPSATDTVEMDVLKAYKSFASQQRMNTEKAVRNKARADKEVKLTELKRFANSFKLSTPVPTDLVSIIAKDPAKQKEIQAKAIRNAEEVAKAKADSDTKGEPAVKSSAGVKQGDQAGPAVAPVSQNARGSIPGQVQGQHMRGQGPHQKPFVPNQYAQPYRNGRGPAPSQQPGTLAQRLRNVEHQKFANAQQQQPQQQNMGPGDGRVPPTGPASSNVDANFNRRYSALPAHASTGKLNPNSMEFRPSPFAASFQPTGPISASSSPRSAANNVSESSGTSPPSAGQLIRRKTKAVDVNKCNILSHIKTITAPQGRNWDDNGGLRPSYDTLPTWRQLKDGEKADSTMHLTYKAYFEQRQPFTGSSLTTPNPGHAVPQMAHQHQLPFHLQQGASGMGPRQSPHMTPMRMDQTQQAGMHHPPYGNDDHRMMPSNSSQSYASPRPGAVPMAYPGVNTPSQMQYSQPVFMSPGLSQMGQFRSFSNSSGYMPPQHGQLNGPMMMQPPFMQGPQGMMPGHQMMYPGQHHPQYMTPGGPPQPPVPGPNGYPSPGRHTAPMMMHQGSQQGQSMYGMSPGVQFSQPAYGPGQPGGPMSNSRGYNGPAPQHYGSSPQQPQHLGAQPRHNSNGNYNKNFSPQASQQTAPANATASTGNGQDRHETTTETK